jgi:hypothetical protein
MVNLPCTCCLCLRKLSFLNLIECGDHVGEMGFMWVSIATRKMTFQLQSLYEVNDHESSCKGNDSIDHKFIILANNLYNMTGFRKVNMQGGGGFET